MILEEHLASWPVKHCAAALVGKYGETFGDQHRVFELASVTKLLAAYGVLMAVEEGAFELDTPCGPEGSTVREWRRIRQQAPTKTGRGAAYLLFGGLRDPRGSCGGNHRHRVS